MAQKFIAGYLAIGLITGGLALGHHYQVCPQDWRTRHTDGVDFVASILVWPALVVAAMAMPSLKGLPPRKCDTDM